MKKRILQSVFSGVLLSISWPEIGGLFPLIFVALIPLLLVEDEILSKRYRPGKAYINAYIAFFTFNLLTTWWIWHASAGGAIMAVFFNSALMAIPFGLFHLTRRYIRDKQGYIAFIAYMMAFEWLHFRWELSWPWLSFGNVFANQTYLVQWYEYTGISGGTLWVLLINLILFFYIKTVTQKINEIKTSINEFKQDALSQKTQKTISFAYKFFFQRFMFFFSSFKKEIKLSFLFTITLIAPILLSIYIGLGVDIGEKNETVSIVLSQPNIDPYKKFSDLTASEQVTDFLTVTEPNLNASTDLIIAPETAIPYALDESNLAYSEEANIIKRFLVNYPNTKLLCGMSSYALYDKPISRASQPTSDGLGYYENYNSALLIDNTLNYAIYHKSELVLGVERLPLSFILKYVESTFDLGGTTGTLGTEKEPKIFTVGKAKIAPTICYESIYGETMGNFSKKGANVIAIMTNDAWWYDTPGYKQLLAYAKLRAIESRKWIARSANTGISCFINPKGVITDKTNWEEKTSIKKNVPLIEGQTFYVKNGDYLGRIFLFLAGMLLLFTISKRLRKS